MRVPSKFCLLLASFIGLYCMMHILCNLLSWIKALLILLSWFQFQANLSSYSDFPCPSSLKIETVSTRFCLFLFRLRSIHLLQLASENLWKDLMLTLSQACELFYWSSLLDIFIKVHHKSWKTSAFASNL